MEGNNLIKKGVVVAVILLFVSVSVIPSSATNVVEKSSAISFNGNTLYVGGLGPGNYTTIQAAIDDANNGDTVFVYDDSAPYIEVLIVDKQISVIGENRDTTVIKGTHKSRVLTIKASHVVIRGFTITSEHDDNAYVGIFIDSDNNIIEDNIIKSLYEDGILIWGHGRNTISGNIIADCFNLIRMAPGRYNTITNNVLLEPTVVHIEFMSNSYSNIIFGNHIVGDNESNAIVLWIDANRNEFSQNNFIHTGIIFISSFLNKWKKNYYSNYDGSGPQTIKGLILIPIPVFPFVLPLPWINIDWRPAKEPYDIGV